MGELIPFAWAKRKKQKEVKVTDIYAFQSLEVIAVENLRLEELYADLPEHDPFRRVFIGKRNLEPLQHQEILRRLQSALPEFYENAELRKPYDPTDQREWSVLKYDIRLPQGIATVRTEMYDDLGDALINRHNRCELSIVGLSEFQEEKQEEIAEQVYGKSGILMRAIYVWKGNDGDGLYVGQAKKAKDDGRQFSSSNEYSEAFTRVLNALCYEDKLTLNLILGKETEGTYYEHHDHSIHYSDGTYPLSAGLKDARIDNLRQADQHVGEFMAWIHEQRNVLTELGEMAREICSCYKEANATSAFPNVDQSANQRPHQTAALERADKMYKEAEALFQKLTPPKNERMQYLANNRVEKLL